ncbi:MAG: AbgT family transporter [Phycisphaerales bacterium]
MPLHLAGERPAGRRGLWAALAAFLLAAGAFLAMALVPGGPLTGEVQRHGTTTMVPAWTEAIVPMLLVLFLMPGVAYGATSGEIRSDRRAEGREAPLAVPREAPGRTARGRRAGGGRRFAGARDELDDRATRPGDRRVGR